LGGLGGLAALPAALLAGTVLTAAMGIGFSDGAALICGCITATRLSDKVLRGVQNSTLATLYQALPREGTRVHALMESIVDPMAFGAAALLLLVARQI